MLTRKKQINNIAKNLRECSLKTGFANKRKNKNGIKDKNEYKIFWQNMGCQSPGNIV